MPLGIDPIEFSGREFRRDGRKPITSTAAAQLASASDWHYQGPKNNRWTEISLYITTTGRFIWSITQKTQWEGERNQYDAGTSDSFAGLIESLASRNDVEPGFITPVAQSAIERAVRNFPALRADWAEAID